MPPYPLKEFTTWFSTSGTRKLDAILQGQEDARRRMDDLIAAINTKDDWDESVLALMHSMSDQILAAAGDNEEAVVLSNAVKEKAALAAELLADAARHKSVENGHREDHGQRTVRTERRELD